MAGGRGGGGVSPDPIHDPNHLVGGMEGEGFPQPGSMPIHFQCVDPCLLYVCYFVVYIVTIM